LYAPTVQLRIAVNKRWKRRDGLPNQLTWLVKFAADVAAEQA
jgi:hypothetical protein